MTLTGSKFITTCVSPSLSDTSAKLWGWAQSISALSLRQMEAREIPFNSLLSNARSATMRER